MHCVRREGPVGQKRQPPLLLGVSLFFLTASQNVQGQTREAYSCFYHSSLWINSHSLRAKRNCSERHLQMEKLVMNQTQSSWSLGLTGRMQGLLVCWKSKLCSGERAWKGCQVLQGDPRRRKPGVKGLECCTTELLATVEMSHIFTAQHGSHEPDGLLRTWDVAGVTKILNFKFYLNCN